MAPSKKKKKPASNPARGFATTSTASKPKVDVAKEFESGVLLDIPEKYATPINADAGTLTEKPSNEEREKALHELTPEELESQLENSGLQILIEKHGEKTNKEASRQVFRLQTERRLLRSQADHLSIRQWLPPEIMQLITDMLQAKDDSNGILKTTPGSNNATTDLCEDDLLIKLWALKRILLMLGFQDRMTDLAICHSLAATPNPCLQSLASGKEPVWGLDECLAWLGLNSELLDLPRFEGREGQSRGAADQKRSGIGANTPDTTPAQSRPESPLGKDYPPQQLQIDEDSTLSSASDSDSDVEPEQLVRKYLELQSQLHDISPELTENHAKQQRRGKSKQPVVNGVMDSSRERRIERIRAKIHRIKSDLLFDEDEANGRWADIRIDLAQEAAERKRLGIRKDTEQKVTPTTQSNNHQAKSQQEDVTDDILSDFFSSLPETVTDPVTGSSIISTANQEGRNVEIRDFGKWTGVSPRRALEEACRAR